MDGKSMFYSPTKVQCQLDRFLRQLPASYTKRIQLQSSVVRHTTVKRASQFVEEDVVIPKKQRQLIDNRSTWLVVEMDVGRQERILNMGGTGELPSHGVSDKSKASHYTPCW
jgi:hypothetical protein